MARRSAILSVQTVTFLASLAWACGKPPSSASAPAADAGAAPTITEDVVVIVQSDEDALPLEGATVAIEQNGVISVQESDREGRASFVFDPEGNPVAISASYRKHRALTRVAVEVDKLVEAKNTQQGVLMVLRRPPPPMIQVNGSFRRQDVSAALAVETNTDGSGSLPAGWYSDRFSAFARVNEAFVLTVYEQMMTNDPVSSLTGASWPILWWRTLSHGGSAGGMDVTGERFTSHELGQRSLTIPRPTTPPSMASDDATPFVSAYAWSARYPYKELATAETSGIEPWVGKTIST